MSFDDVLATNHDPPIHSQLPIKGLHGARRDRCGDGYLKALGNPEGPHILASEWIATKLAAWFGLSVFDHAIVMVDEFVEIRHVDAEGNLTGIAATGPAFITRREAGETWSGDRKQLKRLVNPHDVSRLVVFETWLLNCDRYSRANSDPLTRARINRNNVFLSEEAPNGQFTLKAMDHSGFP
jgi:hypothetical protein